MPGPTVYDAKWQDRTIGYTHQLVVTQVPLGSRVLDVGSAGGYLAEVLRDQRQCEVVCLDSDAGSVEKAISRGFEARLVDLDVEPINGVGFDVVIFADVLEHLRHPAATLRQAYGSRRVVVSVPNVGHWWGRRQLLAGRFPKDPDGLFDRTHLQFLTRATVRELAYDSGWSVVAEQFVGWRLPFESFVRGLHRLRLPAAHRFPELFAYQIVLTLEPA
jgi:methionine biosynthesis protein MetW